MADGTSIKEEKTSVDGEDLLEGAMEVADIGEEDLDQERLLQAVSVVLGGDIAYLKTTAAVLSNVRAVTLEVPPGKSATKILAVMDAELTGMKARIERVNGYLDGRINVDTVSAAERMASAHLERALAKQSEAKATQNSDSLTAANTKVKDTILALLKIREDKESLQ